MAAVACLASAATRNSVHHDPALGVAINPTRCLRRAATLGVPARVVYDGDSREEWLSGVEVLVLDAVACLPRETMLRIVRWATEASSSVAAAHGARMRTLVASAESGICDGLGRDLPAELTMWAELTKASGHTVIPPMTLNSTQVGAVLQAHSWIGGTDGGTSAAPAAEGHRIARLITAYATAPSRKQVNTTVFVMCADAAECGQPFTLRVPSTNSGVFVREGGCTATARLSAPTSSRAALAIRPDPSAQVVLVDVSAQHASGAGVSVAILITTHCP
jgi:hypothetical protein